MAFGNSLNEATNSGTGYDATADGTQTRKLASVPVDRIPWSTDPPSPAAPVELQPDNRVWSQKTPEQDMKTLKEVSRTGSKQGKVLRMQSFFLLINFPFVS